MCDTRIDPTWLEGEDRSDISYAGLDHVSLHPPVPGCNDATRDEHRGAATTASCGAAPGAAPDGEQVPSGGCDLPVLAEGGGRRKESPKRTVES